MGICYSLRYYYKCERILYIWDAIQWVLSSIYSYIIVQKMLVNVSIVYKTAKEKVLPKHE